MAPAIAVAPPLSPDAAPPTVEHPPATPGRLLLDRGSFLPTGELGVTLGPVPFAPPPGIPFDVVAGTTLDPATLLPTPGGNAVITGLVRDSLRFPLANARVEAREGGRLVAVASTDETGRFVLGGLVRTPHELRVLDGEHPATSRAGVVPDGPSLELVMELGGGVEALVRDARTLGPLDGVRLEGVGPGGRRAETVSSAGVARLQPLVPGRWSIEVTKPGYADARVSVDVPAGSRRSEITVRDVRVELAPGATVGGVVIDEHGQAVAGAEVRVGTLRTRTDADGRFVLQDAAAGDLVVAAAHDAAGEGSARIGVHPGDEVLSLQIRLER